MRRKTLSLEIVSLGFHFQTIGFPLVSTFIDVETGPSIEPQFIIRGERDPSIGLWQSGRRIIQLSKSEDQRMMIRRLFVIEEVSEKTAIGQI